MLVKNISKTVELVVSWSDSFSKSELKLDITEKYSFITQNIKI